MQYPVSITVNGVQRKHPVEARLLLVHFLRETLGLTGTNIGCDTSQCGSLHGAHGRQGREVLHASSRSRPTARRSRRSKASRKTESSIPLQDAFWENHGLQCGFCTPGMIMTACDLLEKTPQPTDAQIRVGLEGNLCRCTGYQNIVAAVKDAAGRMAKA